LMQCAAGFPANRQSSTLWGTAVLLPVAMKIWSCLVSTAPVLPQMLAPAYPSGATNVCHLILPVRTSSATALPRNCQTQFALGTNAEITSSFDATPTKTVCL